MPFLRMRTRAVPTHGSLLSLEFKMADVTGVKTVIVILDRNDKRKRNHRVSFSGGCGSICVVNPEFVYSRVTVYALLYSIILKMIE